MNGIKLATFLTLLGVVWGNAGRPAGAEPLLLESGSARTHLLELYTSEGCNSCPPADTWLSALRHSPELWRTVVPVAFHVTYWDYLGWADRFGAAAFDARHRQVARVAGSQVYTPGVFLDGREWRRWWNDSLDSNDTDLPDPGVLRAEVTGDEVAVTFVTQLPLRSPTASLALLKSGRQSHVTRGENRGRTLQHDFIASPVRTIVLSRDANRWRGTLRVAAQQQAAADAIALWVTDHNGLPVQAAGRWLR